MIEQFLSCDWGTSSFRLRWMNGGSVIREHRESTGCKAIFDQSMGMDRTARYAQFLRNILERWPASETPIPLVISGMASSTIGWKELPYAPLPLRADGSNLRFELLSWDAPEWIAKTVLISGVAGQEEMLRGEEIEAIGLLQDTHLDESKILVLPGTHSKHLLVRAGEVVSFRTYMTGELFDLLARHSILRSTLDLAALENPLDEHLSAFDVGASEADRNGIFPSLFKTRARAVLQNRPAGENAWFLSGLLIGGELADLAKRAPDCAILLGGAGRLRTLYVRAANALRFGRRCQTLPADLVEMAVPTGHGIFLKPQTV